MPQTTKLIKTYIDLYKSYPKRDVVSRNDFRMILKYFHNLIRRGLIYEGKIFALPLYLGAIGILSRRPASIIRIHDFQYYKETGIKVSRLNHHAQGLVCKVHRIYPTKTYSRDMSIPIMKGFKFEACRALNRELAKAIINENTIGLYLEYELRQH